MLGSLILGMVLGFPGTMASAQPYRHPLDGTPVTDAEMIARIGTTKPGFDPRGIRPMGRSGARPIVPGQHNGENVARERD